MPCLTLVLLSVLLVWQQDKAQPKTSGTESDSVTESQRVKHIATQIYTAIKECRCAAGKKLLSDLPAQTDVNLRAELIEGIQACNEDDAICNRRQKSK